MFCTNCGSQIPDGSAFCPECGAKLTAPASYAAAPVRTKKGMSRGALIGIIAAAVAVIAAAVILILVLNKPEQKLLGTWVYKEDGEEHEGVCGEGQDHSLRG